MPREAASASRVIEATAAVRRVVGARIRDPHDREDLVQATLVKVAAAQERLGDAALEGYAIVTARNVVISHYRRESTHRRHVHRLVEYTTIDGPEELSLRQEETDALASALDRLTPEERQLLLAHEVDGISTADLAAQHESTPGGVAVRLARARARLRLEFLLVFRNVELPTQQCRPVLLALSAGERRRQIALHAAEHLVECETCANLSAPLIERRRAIAGLLPLIALRHVFETLRRLSKNGKVQTAVGVSAVIGTVAIVLLAPPSSHPRQSKRPSPRPAVEKTAVSGPIQSPLTSGANPLIPFPAGGLATFEGRPVAARMIAVVSVPADEGAWIGTNTDRIWVEFIGPAESPFRIQKGQHLTFTGKLVRNPSGYSNIVGLKAGPDAARLDQMGVHLEVTYRSLQIGAKQ